MRVLSTRWNGERANVALSYSLFINEGRLCFSLDFLHTARSHPESETGVFTAELWKWDVGEVFISGGNGKYVEVNLAPSGAWWMQGFSTVREVDVDFSVSNHEVKAGRGKYSCDLVALEDYLGSVEEWKANVTAILNSPDYEFLSAIKLPGKEADFHQPRSFISFSKLID